MHLRPSHLITSHSAFRSTCQCSGQLVNVNGGEIKDLRSEEDHVHHAQSDHEDHLSHCRRCREPIIGLDALHQYAVQFHPFQSSKACLQQKGHRQWGCSASLLQVLFLWFRHSRFHQRISTSMGRPRARNIRRTLQSTNHIIAEIDFEVNSESRLSISAEEESDPNQEVNSPQCFSFKTPESVSAAEKKAHSLTHMPCRTRCTVCQRAKGQQHTTKALSVASIRFKEKWKTSKCSRLWRRSLQCQEPS